MENVDRNLEEQIRNLRDRTSDALDRRVLADLGAKLQESEASPPALRSAGMWRTIMINKRVRIAAAAVVALAVLLPAGYAAVEAVVSHFILSEDSVSFEYPEPNGTAVYSVGRMTGIFSVGVASEEEARARYEEFLQLYREGKAKEIQPGVWQATLSNGERFNFGGDPEHPTTEITAEEKEQWKKQFDEINELRKAGKGERTFLEEIEQDGVKIRRYEVRYTLSDGSVVTFTEAVGPDGRGGGGGGLGGGGLGGGGSSGGSVR